MSTRPKRKPRPSVPRWLRPRLDAGQLRDLALTHFSTVDAIARGEGSDALMQSFAQSALIWSRIAEQMKLHEQAMAAQLEVAHALMRRFAATRKVVFTGQELQAARICADAMDELASVVDVPTAIDACNWAERRVDKAMGMCREQ